MQFVIFDCVVDPYAETELCGIMKEEGSDKSRDPDVRFSHNYTTVYSEIFAPFRERPVNLFELGIGSKDPLIPSNMGKDGKPGASLRGWRRWFKNAMVYGADIDVKTLFTEEGIRTCHVDQRDTDSIKKLWDKFDQDFDIIIDDGLHHFQANHTFLMNSWEKLSPGGFYVVEDIQPSDYTRVCMSLRKYREELDGVKDAEIVHLPGNDSLGNTLLILQKKA